MRTKPTLRMLHSAILGRWSAAQLTTATSVKSTPLVLVEIRAAVMSPLVFEPSRFHCFGRYSKVDTLVHTPPRSIVIVCGSVRLPPRGPAGFEPDVAAAVDRVIREFAVVEGRRVGRHC